MIKIQNEVKVMIQFGIELSLLRCLLSVAFENSSNYWYMIDREELPKGVTYKDFQVGGRFSDPDVYYGLYQLMAFHEGCTLVIIDTLAVKGDDNYKKEFRLNRSALEKGIRVMADKYPHHFKSVIEENMNDEIGDCYLQCCLFGNCIYN